MDNTLRGADRGAPRSAESQPRQEAGLRRACIASRKPGRPLPRPLPKSRLSPESPRQEAAWPPRLKVGLGIIKYRNDD